MHVISGNFKNRKIHTQLKGKKLNFRPTLQKLKMATLNVLKHSKHTQNIDINGSKILDICAGSGAFGIECLSNNADFCCFIEQNPDHVRLIKQNIDYISPEKCSVIQLDATKLYDNGHKFNIVYIDPPYKEGLAKDILKSLAAVKIVDENHIILVETNSKEDLENINGFEILEVKLYGDTKLTIGKISL
jgi:16S rRNA (guanine966-N2)-methyltransferase